MKKANCVLQLNAGRKINKKRKYLSKYPILRISQLIFFFFQMAAQCVTKVELSVSCNSLIDKDVGSKSDPLCVLLHSSGDDKWTEVSPD